MLLLQLDIPLAQHLLCASVSKAAGIPVSAWVEQALRQALEARAEPPQPEGMEFGELEAMVRRVMAEELRPVQETLAGRNEAAEPGGDGAVEEALAARHRASRRGSGRTMDTRARARLLGSENEGHRYTVQLRDGALVGTDAQTPGHCWRNHNNARRAACISYYG